MDDTSKHDHAEHSHTDALAVSCPAPLSHDTIQLAHGGGGRLMRNLVDNVFVAAFDNGPLQKRHDSALLNIDGARLAFTTDSYVVHPRFFPGGDIGQLAVIGTVNDLAMAGAVPRWLSAGFVIEEGLATEELVRIVESMQRAARRCGVQIVTGDTKVVDRGKGDGVFINTAGIGTVAHGVDIAPSAVQPGDHVLVSGDLGRHGIAVLSAREGLGFEGDVASDCAPLHTLVAELLAAGVELRCLRDLTRGGLASALNEVARDGCIDIDIEEAAVPVSDAVRGACEMLGLDPLYVACEGRLVAFVSAETSEKALAIMRTHDSGAQAANIGRASLPNAWSGSAHKNAISTSEDAGTRRIPGRVSITGVLGAARVLDLLSGEQLPRIC